MPPKNNCTNFPDTSQWVIPYGSLGVPVQVLDALRAGQTKDLERPGAPVVVINVNQHKPLRMHDLLHPFTLPPVAQDLAHAETQLAFLQQHLSRHCGDWARPSQEFVARYFADLRAAVRENDALLTAKAGEISGLVEIDHWCFAALMPLPRAHLYLPSTDKKRDFQPSDFVMVDFSFWNGKKLVAVVIDNGNTPTSARKRALDRLAENDIDLHSISKDILKSEQTQALLIALGPAFQNFWSDVSFARSPFRGRGIDSPVRYES